MQVNRRDRANKPQCTEDASRAVGWPSPVIASWMKERLRAAEADPGLVPDEPFRFLRMPEVLSRTGLGRTTLYRRIENGTFPRPIPLGSNESAASA
jgi:predicted DNA-binding transcriptional regulator AlpA